MVCKGPARYIRVDRLVQDFARPEPERNIGQTFLKEGVKMMVRIGGLNSNKRVFANSCTFVLGLCKN